MTSSQAIPPSTPSSPATRPVIAALIGEIGRTAGNEFIQGLTDAADEFDVDLVCFVGGKFTNTQAAGLYQLVDPKRLDGLILSGDIISAPDRANLQSFCQGLAPLPVIASGLELPGLPSISPDHQHGVRQVLDHLVQVHGCGRIAFICGPTGLLDAQERYRAYVDGLAAHGLSLDPNLVVPGDFTSSSGAEAVYMLLDERKAQFDAILAANDLMAIGALEALQASGFQVPAEVALAGLDDIAESQILDIPLTSVRKSEYITGRMSMAALLMLLRGESVPADQLKSPTDLVVRWSCGCLPEITQRAAIKYQTVPLHGSPSERRDQAINRLAQAEALPLEMEPSAWSAIFASLWDGFQDEVGDPSTQRFLKLFNQVLHQLQNCGFTPVAMHDLLSLFRQLVLQDMNLHETLRGEDLLHQARLLLGEFTRRAQAYQRYTLEHQENQLQRFSFTIAPVLYMRDLAPAVEQHFPGMLIDHCQVALYEGDDLEGEAGVSTQARLLIRYANEQAEFYEAGPLFPSRQLEFKAPGQSEPLPCGRRTSILMPLSMRDNHFGFINIEVGPRDWEIYTRLRNLFSSAIFRSLLMEQREQARHEVEHLLNETKLRAAELALAKEAAEAAARQAHLALHETESLLQTVRAILGATEVSDICRILTQQFNDLVQCDRVSIFLVDNEQQTITLALQNGDVHDESPITYAELDQGISGIVFRSHQPVLSLSAEDGIEPAETAGRRRSAGIGALIVVPLLHKGQILGTVTALNQQDQRAFTQHDVDLLLSLATQAAAAIANAQLYEVEQNRRHWAEALEQVGRNLVSSLDLQRVPGRILEELAVLSPYERGSIMLEEGPEMRIIAQHGFPSDERALELRVPIRSGDVFQQVVAARSPVLVGDVTQVQGWSQVDWLPLNKSWMGVPLITKDRVIGMVSLTRKEANAFSAEDAALVSTFSYQAAIALENARLYEETTRFNERLEHWVEQRTEELNKAMETLEKLHKNKSDFINVAAHELRTPLTVLKGYTAIMQTDPTIQSNPYLLEALKSVLKGTDRLHEIVNSMLDVARIDSETLSISRETTSLAHIIHTLHKEFTADLSARHLDMSVEDLSELPLILADTNMMYKVFYNLIINSIKYTPDNGKIWITGRAIHDEHRGEYVEVAVHDTGIGIDTEHQELIFEKFYQTGKVAFHSSGKTKFKGGGPGLGLSIARGIVNAHGGKIWVESPRHDEQACPGSIFHVLLPVKP